MRVRAVSWVGVKTDSYQSMRDFFGNVAGLAVDYERPDFVVFRFPSGDKLEVFGPAAGGPARAVRAHRYRADRDQTGRRR